MDDRFAEAYGAETSNAPSAPGVSASGMGVNTTGTPPGTQGTHSSVGVVRELGPPGKVTMIFQNAPGSGEDAGVIHYVYQDPQTGLFVEKLSDGRTFQMNAGDLTELQGKWQAMAQEGRGNLMSPESAAELGLPTMEETTESLSPRTNDAVQTTTTEELVGTVTEVTTAILLGKPISLRNGTQVSVSEYIETLDPQSPLRLMYEQGDPSKLDPRSSEIYQTYLDGMEKMRNGEITREAFEGAVESKGKLATAGDDMFGAAGQSFAQQQATAEGMTQDIGQLRAAANGQVDSAAAIQQRQGISDAIATQQAAAAQVRGGNAAAAMRQALAGGTQMMSRGIGDASALRANEQAGARAALTDASAKQGMLFGDAGRGRTDLGAIKVDRAGRVLDADFKLGAATAAERTAGIEGARTVAERDVSTHVAQENARIAHAQNVATLVTGAQATASGNATNFEITKIENDHERELAKKDPLDRFLETAGETAKVASLYTGKK